MASKNGTGQKPATASEIEAPDPAERIKELEREVDDLHEQVSAGQAELHKIRSTLATSHDRELKAHRKADDHQDAYYSLLNELQEAQKAERAESGGG